MKIYLLSEELEQLCTKPRFAKLFDFVVVGFYHAQDVKGPFPSLLRDNALIYFVGIKKELKQQCIDKGTGLALSCGLQPLSSPYAHHSLFQFSATRPIPPPTKQGPEKEELKKDVSKEDKPYAEEIKKEEPTTGKSHIEDVTKEEQRADDPHKEHINKDEPKTDETGKGESKTDGTNKEEPKVDETNKEEPKADETKKEEPKAEETKKGEPKVDETKKGEPKADETNKEEYKGDEIKKEEPKIDEPKNDPMVEIAKVEVQRKEETSKPEEKAGNKGKEAKE